MATMVDRVDEKLKVGVDVFIPAMRETCRVEDIRGGLCYLRLQHYGHLVAWPVRLLGGNLENEKEGRK